MEKWENKTNNEISVRLIEMEYEHNNIKQEMLRLNDKMLEIEQDYVNGKRELDKRLKISFNNE